MVPPDSLLESHHPRLCTPSLPPPVPFPTPMTLFALPPLLPPPFPRALEQSVGSAPRPVHTLPCSHHPTSPACTGAVGQFCPFICAPSPCRLMRARMQHEPKAHAALVLAGLQLQAEHICTGLMEPADIALLTGSQSALRSPGQAALSPGTRPAGATWHCALAAGIPLLGRASSA